jgi:hypothetical protein
LRTPGRLMLLLTGHLYDSSGVALVAMPSTLWLCIDCQPCSLFWLYAVIVTTHPFDYPLALLLHIPLVTSHSILPPIAYLYSTQHCIGIAYFT